MTASAEHAVAEERQARVGVAAPLAPGGVREHLSRELLGQLVQQLCEQHHRSHRPLLMGEHEVDRLRRP